MKFSCVTIFPNIMQGYFTDSILKKAIDSNIIDIDFINPRDFTESKHKKVDDTIYGGGAGMLMTPQPLFSALEDIKNKNKNSYIVFLTPSAKKFVQKDSIRLSKKEHIVLVSGRYEGIDERVIEEYANEVFSIGDFILTGGELASLVLIDAISRNIKGVLGSSLSLEEESFNDALLEPPHFTKPKEIKNLTITSEFLKGNHSKINTLKKNMSILRTKYYRPDLKNNFKDNHEK